MSIRNELLLGLTGAGKTNRNMVNNPHLQYLNRNPDSEKDPGWRQEEYQRRRRNITEALGATGVSSTSKKIMSNLLGAVAETAGKELAWADHWRGGDGLNVNDSVAGRARNRQMKEDYMSGVTGLPQVKQMGHGLAGTSRPGGDGVIDQIAQGMAPAYQRGVLQDLGAIGNATPGFEVQQQMKADAAARQQQINTISQALRETMGSAQDTQAAYERNWGRGGAIPGFETQQQYGQARDQQNKTAGALMAVLRQLMGQ